MNIIKENVLKLSSYTVDQDLSLVKLNQNEAPYDVPLEFKKEVWAKLKRRGWHRYPPDGRGRLQGQIAAYTGFPSSGILMGNGSNELIQALFLAVCEPDDLVLMVKPGYAVSYRAAKLLSARLIEIPLRADFNFDVPAIMERAGEARLTILASPNNPTGTCLRLNEIACIAERAGGLLVVDEAYYEFSGRTAQPLVAGRENVVILRTFSKAWRLAGARLGYLLGPREFVREVAKVRLPFSVSVFAQAAAEVMLEHREQMAGLARTIIRERKRVFKELANIPGITPVPSSANFILFGIRGHSAPAFFKELRDKGVLVRLFDNPLLEKHLRVTIGAPQENDAFLAAVRKIMGGPVP